MTKQSIANHCQVSEEIAARVLGLIRGTIDPYQHAAVIAWAEQCYHDPRDQPEARPECVMLAINHEIQGYGVEAIRGRYVDRYHQDIQAVYVNQGDTYTGTILYDHERERYILTSWGDWVERNSTRRGIE